MRFRDLANFALSALRQQKVRTILTMIGVIVGTFTLVMSLSIGRGVDRAILALFRETDSLRKIEIRTRFETRPEDIPESERTPAGAMGDARRKRMQHALAKRFDQGRSRKELTPLVPETLEKIRKLKHVEIVEPRVSFNGKAVLLESNAPEVPVSIASAAPGSPSYRERLLSGEPQAIGPDGVVVHEYLLYRWGYDGDDLSGALGLKIRLQSEFKRSAAPSILAIIKASDRRWTDDEIQALGRFLTHLKEALPTLPVNPTEKLAATKVFERMRLSSPADTVETFEDEFVIRGVVRQAMESDRIQPNLNTWQIQDAVIILPTEAATKIYSKTTWARDHGFNDAWVTVDEEANVKSVSKKLEELGFVTISLTQVIDSVRLNILLITFATTFIAVVALVVAALGITNTMIMSVLERTREIGIIKALGARNSQILAIFLIEGVLIGLIGGLLGLGLAYLASFPGDRIARAIIEPQTRAPISGRLFIFPPWLVLGAPLIACVITTLAALYPAQRAAKLDSISSLRHE